MTPSERTILWRKNNPDKARDLSRRMAARIKFKPDRLLRRRATIRKCWQKNKERYTAIHKNWLKNNPSAQVAHRTNDLMRYAIRYGRQSKILATLGHTIDDLRHHIESQFTPQMSWSNYGRYGWVIDHIIPCSKFDLTQPDQLKACYALSNLRPLWHDQNLYKHASDGLTPAQIELSQNPSQSIVDLTIHPSVFPAGLGEVQ